MYLKGYHVEEDKVLDFPHWMSSSRGLKPPFEDILEKIFLLPAGGSMRWPYPLPRFLFSEWGMLELEEFYIDLHRLTGKQVVCTDINSFLPKKIFTYLKLHVCTASKSKTQCTCIHMCPSLIMFHKKHFHSISSYLPHSSAVWNPQTICHSFAQNKMTAGRRNHHDLHTDGKTHSRKEHWKWKAGKKQPNLKTFI